MNLYRGGGRQSKVRRCGETPKGSKPEARRADAGVTEALGDVGS